jgi:hypothetical protein
LNWIERAHGQLQNVFSDPVTLDVLESGSYWHIRNNWDDPRPYDLIFRECELQKVKLNGLADYLDRIREFITARSPSQTTFAVPDTNVLLHGKPYRELPWLQLTGETSLRLIVPLKVIEELDDHKHHHKVLDVRHRARAVVRSLWEDVSANSDSRAEIAPNVTLEVPIGLWPRVRTTDSDEEVRSFASQLRGLQVPVLVITDDIGMSLLAAAEQLAVKQLREEDRLKLR